MMEIRQQQTLRGNDDCFYWVMNDYLKEYVGTQGFESPSLRKHKSPTKRLISMKNTAFAHKKVLNEQGIDTDI
jgi:hypothetical protein